jgi:hypothetical protein
LYWFALCGQQPRLTGTSLEVEGCSGDELDDVDEFVPSHFHDDVAEYYRNTTTAASQFFSKKQNVVLVIAAVVFVNCRRSM